MAIAARCHLRLNFGIYSYFEESEMLYLPNESGQGLVEYALIVALLAIVVIVILSLLGPTIGNVFSNIYASV